MKKLLSMATQVIEVLFVVDSRFELPHNKAKAIKKSCKRMLQVHTQTVWQLAHLVDVLTATWLATTLSMISNLCYETQVTLDAIARSFIGGQTRWSTTMTGLST